MPFLCHLAGKDVPTFRDATFVRFLDVNAGTRARSDILIVFAQPISVPVLDRVLYKDVVALLDGFSAAALSGVA